MGDGVLDDQRVDPLGVSQRHAETDGASVVLHVEGVARQPHRLREVIHHGGKVIEGVRELLGAWRIAVSEARVVRRDHVVAIPETGEKRLEHAGGGGKPVKEQDRRPVLRTGLSIEDGQAVDRHGPI